MPLKHTEESSSNDSVTKHLNEVFWEVIKKPTITTLKKSLSKSEFIIPQKCTVIKVIEKANKKLLILDVDAEFLSNASSCRL